MEFYTLKIVGLERKLPLIHVGKNTKIASFSILGDVELVDAIADTMADKIRTLNLDIDCLVCPEVKAVPLVHGVAKRLGHKRFVVCRKSIKPYMISAVKIEPLSYFPKHAKPLVIDGVDAQFIKDKNVLIIDDIISSGVTMRMMNYLMQKVEAKVVGYFAVLKQGEQFDNFQNLHFLSELPLYSKKSSTAENS